ncbi:metal-dependent hydrolase [Marinobacter sp. TBZ242]|uniref:Metal-dependent hydrolase n=1 Tax=Marinobacter azerbaijanicus TaxID=3050455 RepID=A0ABT7IA38_9GAMM|nr:metal-dependent hydrolase [Marinobacter sp. TBZ242]MDL0431031.1 metal-dependent hydrolase [Marinobacter sp. TBZ242]
MDSITQAALGASLAGAVAGKTLGRSALLIGAALGTLPDLDVVIDYGTAVANFTQHRGFSHSLFILFPLSLFLAYALHRWRPLLSYRRWLAVTALILLTHPLLDAFTTYGTQLFWPFGPPVAINSIFIIDPLYTLPLLAGILAFLLRGPQTRTVTVGLALSTLYLGWSVTAQQIISDRVEPALAKESLQEAPRMVQPMPFNTLLWRVTVMGENRRVEIVTGFLDGDGPITLENFPRDPELAKAAASLEEGRRLEWFTDGFLHYERANGKLTATDIRLGIPGAHPFTFVLARDNGEGLEPEPSSRLERPVVAGELLGVLWDRMTGSAEVLCLASLSLPPPGEGCT